ncbi:uncharacterized protein AruCF_2672 [Achromobacter ruhlandii]|nr:uncharacterized protein AruCF_2672 [Achromobacter ruhlandii]
MRSRAPRSRQHSPRKRGGRRLPMARRSQRPRPCGCGTDERPCQAGPGQGNANGLPPGMRQGNSNVLDAACNGGSLLLHGAFLLCSTVYGGRAAHRARRLGAGEAATQSRRRLPGSPHCITDRGGLIGARAKNRDFVRHGV